VAVAEGSVNLGERILTLVTTGHASKDSAASKLRPHTTQNRDTTAALKILREVASSSESQTNRPAYEAYLSLSDIQQRALVTSIYLLDSSPSIADTRDQILKRMRISARPQFLEAVYERVEGWWFNRLIQHLSSDSSTPILYRELLDQINDIQEQYHADDLPIDFLDAIAPNEDELGQHERAFIEQLRLVAVGEPRIRKAINDYYRAFQQRSKWVREELLLVGEIEEYEKRLVDEWERLFEAMKENMGDDKDEAVMKHEGRALFDTVQKLGINIRPRCDEPYVMRGSYHILANQLRVGWHAEFLNRLSNLL
jgi:hypothetical protein